MRASPYNNPLFAEGLASLVSNYVGNPSQTAQNELMAARARNENMTAQYREAMDAGLDGDLGTMMIRALQAGNQYSGNAPKIAAAVRQDQRGTLGVPVRAVRGGSSGGNSSPDALTASMMNLLTKNAGAFVEANADQGFNEGHIPAIVANAVQGYQAQTYEDPMTSLADTLSRARMEDTVVDENTWASGETLGESLGNLFQGPEVQPTFVIEPPGAATMVPDSQKTIALNQAREALAMGKDRGAIEQMLSQMGIDPSEL